MVSLKLSERLKWLCDVTPSYYFSYYSSFLKIFYRSTHMGKTKDYEYTFSLDLYLERHFLLSSH